MIYFVTHEFAPFRAGGSTYVQEVMRSAVKLGYPVRLMAPDYGDEIFPADTDETYPIERVPASGRLTPPGIWALTRALAQRRGVLSRSPIVLSSVGAHMAMLLLRRVYGFRPSQPVLGVFHGSEILRFRNHPFWRRLASGSLSSSMPACASHYVERLLSESGLYPTNTKVLYAPCACPSALVASAAEVPTVGSAAASPFRLLTLARLHPRKGQHLTARALGLLPDHAKKRLRYEIVGEGTPAYRRQVERACIDAGIDFLIRGAVAPGDLSGVYAGSDAYAMTSVSLPNSVEGFGITYLEASIHGRPVIAFRTGGVEEAVLDGETGLIVPDGDLPGAASAVLRLMEDPVLGARLGARGREFAAGFHWENAARVLCDAALA